jgi:murein DD-endopeptidase MepM/ murein hydrolase activator NlpD
MNIILISDRLGPAKSLTLTRMQLIFGLFCIVVMIILLAIGLNRLVANFGDRVNSPFLHLILQHPESKKNQRIQTYVNKNLDFMAAKVGQMQAQLLRLNALGRRLVDLYGIDSQELDFDRIPGQGGTSNFLQQDISFEELSQKFYQLARLLDDRADKLAILDSMLLSERIEQEMLPSAMPLETNWQSSGFGVRIDPFTGKKTFHEGVDFPAKPGTPIKAAAGGIVVYSAYHSDYGNMIEIDHGNDLRSRYAHASKRMVDIGQVVLKGQKIAETGSTGRSTGPHLHFEIRHNGVPLNPSRFLQIPG